MKNLLIVIVFNSSMLLQRPDVSRPTPSELAAAVAKGQIQAEQELADNKARMWVAGEMIGGEWIDRRTGLYFETIPSDIGESEFANTERVKSHNETIQKYIINERLPKNSLKPWDQYLFNISKFVDKSAVDNKPVRLTVEGPEVVSHDGKYHIKIERRRNTDQRSSLENYLIVKDFKGNTTSHKVNVSFLNITWGPANSWFFVYNDKNNQYNDKFYVAYDLTEHRIIRIKKYE